MVRRVWTLQSIGQGDIGPVVAYNSFFIAPRTFTLNRVQASQAVRGEPPVRNRGKIAIPRFRAIIVPRGWGASQAQSTPRRARPR
jgi:hypothetical protein